jgi:hypothetical protein
MKRYKKVVLFAAGALFLGILLASCGGSGGYGGGGGYGGMALYAPMAFTLTSPINVTTSQTPDLKWGASTYATGYHVYLKPAGGSYSLIATVPTTSFMITSALTATTAYDWYVTAYNNAGTYMTSAATFTTGP